MTQTALTREQVLALRPGNNLDLIVAIEVMGHEAGEFKDGWIKLGPKFEGCPKRYSSDMSAVWEVVSAMSKKKWNFVASTEGEDWEATFYWDANRTGFEANGIRAAEAICKAALLAVLDL